jgi:hypothetical protein
MKNYKFAVYFGTWSEIEFVIAGCAKDAAILAKAKRIKEGKEHKVSVVHKWDDSKMDYVHEVEGEDINWN